MKRWWRARRPYVLAPIIYALVRCINLTLRVKVVGWERYAHTEGSRIFAGWHGRSFIGANFFRGKGVWAIISNSNDGDMQNRIFHRFGFHTVRGSTGRGGAKVLVECIKVLRKGAMMAITPDGPRGPSHHCEMGILVMAQRSGAQLVPVGVSARTRWLAPTWDRYMVPCPFSRAIMIFGEPVTIPEDASVEVLEEYRKSMELAMNRIEEDAERAMGRLA